MPYDALLVFSDRQAVTTTAVSQNVIDFGAPSLNPRNGLPLPVSHGASMDVPLVMKVSTGFAGLTSLAVELQHSDAEGTGFTTVAATRAVPVAELKADFEFGFISLPLGATKRYMRLNYVVTGTATAGVITAGIADGFQTAGRV